MGRKNKEYSRSLQQQAWEKLHSMLLAGEGSSKSAAKTDGTISEKIFSFSTFESYWKHVKYFVAWIKGNYPECKTLKAAKKYVNEFLEYRCGCTTSTGKPLSAWTIQLEAASLAKLFGINKDDPKRFTPPVRHRCDIIRSREETKADKHFSKENNKELIAFEKSTGCRRQILETIKPTDYYRRSDIQTELARLSGKTSLTKEEAKTLIAMKDALAVFPLEQDFLRHKSDKGGKTRFSPIIGENKEKVIEKIKSTAPDQKIFGKISKNFDIHSLRAFYACEIYKKSARPIEKIPYDRVNHGSGKKFQSEVYFCRGDFKGRKFDRLAMYKASKALGHNRIDVIANNYLYNI